MARYVIANRRAGKFRESEKRAARSAVEAALGAAGGRLRVLADHNPKDPLARRLLLVEAEPHHIHAIPAHPDLLVEPEILHWNDTRRPSEFAAADRSTLRGPVAAGANSLRVRVTGSGRPLAGAGVTLLLRGPGGTLRELDQVTGSSGRASFSFPESFEASALVAMPAGGHWAMLVRGPDASVAIECPRLPSAGPLGWWHQAVGVEKFHAGAARGIRIGVADTGAGPHPCLAHVRNVGAFVNGGFLPPPQGADVNFHGTHVCGTIGARPVTRRQYAGIAPGAALFSARVFPPEGGAAGQADIANAIDALSRTHRVDLINLSLAADTPSEIELDAIRDALERGTLCVCAAANTGGAVQFPAAFPECVAVSALGLLGVAPPGSMSDSRVPFLPDHFADENLYLANFSCFGPQIACGGPGVAVISTFPERFGLRAPYAALDGTSMAAPAVCATLAVLLAESEQYRALPRDESRARMARRILIHACRDVGLAAACQGRGLPRV